MQVPWERIDEKRFELLVLRLAQALEPQYTWKQTPRSNDGNRDGVAEIARLAFGETLQSEFWMEAKYTTRRAVKKTIFDSTLVSVMLAGQVDCVLFATNAQVPPSLAARIRAAMAVDRRCKPIIADGMVLADWLSREPQIAHEFFGCPTALPVEDVVIASGIHAAATYRAGYFRSLRQLRVGQRYYLRMMVRAPSRKQFHLSAHPETERRVRFIDGLGEPRKAFGLEPLEISIEPKCPGGAFRIQLLLHEHSGASWPISFDVGAVTPEPVRIAHAAQDRARQRLFEALKAFLARPTPMILRMSAAPGMGKSALLTEMLEELDLKRPALAGCFTGDKTTDAHLLVRVVSFLNYGELFGELPLGEHVLEQPYYTGRIPLSRLLKAVSSPTEAEEVIRLLAETGGGRLFVADAPGSEGSVLLLDDVHKLSGAAAHVLSLILADLVGGKLPVLAVIAARNEFCSAALEQALSRCLPIPIAISPPDAQDLEKTVRSIHGGAIAPLADWLMPVLDNHVVIGRFLEVMRQRRPGDAEFHGLAEETAGAWMGTDFRTRKWASTQVRDAVDLVYSVPGGVPRAFLENRWSPLEFERVLASGLFREEHQSCGAVLRPFHDLYVSLNETQPDPLSSTLLELAQDFIATDEAGGRSLLSALLRRDATTARHFYALGWKECGRLIGETRFGQALQLAQGLQKAEELLRPMRTETRERVAAAYWLAEALVHCGSTSEARSALQTAMDLAEAIPGEIGKPGLWFRAKAESYSVRFWELDVMGLQADLQAIVQQMQTRLRTRPAMARDHDFRHALFGAMNRSMMVAFLLDDDVAGELAMQAARTVTRKLDSPTDEGILLHDHARCRYRQAPEQALLQLLDAQARLRGSSNLRRSLVIDADSAFLSAVVEGTGTDAVLEAGTTLADQGFSGEYMKALLKAAALALWHGDQDLADCTVKRYLASSLADRSLRLALLAANIRTVLAAITGHREEQRAQAQRHFDLSSEIGKSYHAVAVHNRRAENASRVCWSHERDWSGAIVLETRIW